MNLDTMLRVFEAAGMDRDLAWKISFYHLYERRSGDDRRAIDRGNDRRKMTIMVKRNDVVAWMNREREHYIDMCGENNCTGLAEDAADALDIYEADGSTIPEWVFDLSFEVLTAWNPQGNYVGP